MSRVFPTPFNSALETGVRTLTILVACFPKAHDLNRLVKYDYLIVHSADADGPPSLHPALPLRSAELLVRRGLIESGLRLMMSRGLVLRVFKASGVLYSAEEAAGAFLDNMRANYITCLSERADWVAETFDRLSAPELEAICTTLFSAWTIEFQPVELGAQEELF